MISGKLVNDNGNKITVVAEIKSRSPYGYENKLSEFDQFKIANSIGDIISVHTNPLWGGSYQLLAYIRKLTNKPILAKGFHCTQWEVNKAFEYGANYVLTVGWWNGDPRCWFEAESLKELNSTADVVVWNARNPRTGEIRGVPIGVARDFRKGKLCQASMIKTDADIHSKVDMVLVGESLYE